MESIRGVAALVVILHHLVLTFHSPGDAPGSPPPAYDWFLMTTPLRACHDGKFAVRIFFVLSGLVLSLSYFRRRDPELLSSAAIRRYPRLMIPVLAVVLIGWGVLKAGGYRNQAASAMPDWPGTFVGKFLRFDMSFAEAFRQGLDGVFLTFNPERTLNIYYSCN